MLLSRLFDNYHGEDLDIKAIRTSSKDIEPGDLFVCIKGANVDRHDFINQALAAGAVALVTAKDVDVTVPYIKVEDPNEILFELYSRFYHYPQSKLILIGITGTDGKTSTATMIQQLIGPEICGYIGTNGYSGGGLKGETENTTPSIDVLFSIFNQFVEAGCRYVAMEASSEAFFYGRLKGLNFNVGCLTNIDREHLNTHKTMENYINCKTQLFRQSEIAVLNSHDKHFQTVANELNIYHTYGYCENDDLYIKDYQLQANGTDITYFYNNDEYQIHSPLLAAFNVENLSAAITALLMLGFEFNRTVKNISSLDVDGRMQSINLGQDFYVLVDYAHTPNGLRRLFEFTNQLTLNRRIVVTGNAGGRDAGKRHDVGYLCATNNDYVIFTMEDPRFEDPLAIIEDLTADIKDMANYETVVDRAEAIKRAIELAETNDLVMILGKGNEDYQLIKDEYVPFNDIDEAIKAIKRIREEK